MKNSASDNASHGLRFNPHVAALPPYNAGMNVEVARAISGQHDIARLASNENPEGCSPAVMKALASAAYEPWRYADPACTALRAALAHKLAVDAQQIVVGNGSEEMIAAIARALLVPGARVLAQIEVPLEDICGDAPSERPVVAILGRIDETRARAWSRLNTSTGLAFVAVGTPPEAIEILNGSGWMSRTYRSGDDVADLWLDLDARQFHAAR